MKARGMTLMELLVVIVILGILSAIAVPSYRQYLVRSQRAEAKIALLQLQTAQEKFYLQNNEYTDDVTTASPTGLGLLSKSETGKYDISITLEEDEAGNANQRYVATAAPAADGGQSDDGKCASFTIDERGTRGNTGEGGPEYCWK
jgi:type IV pilus assembly protein PilE